MVGLFSRLIDPQQLPTGRKRGDKVTHVEVSYILLVKLSDLCHVHRLGLLWMLNPSGLQQDSCCVTQDQVPLKADTFQIVLCFKSTYAS